MVCRRRLKRSDRDARTYAYQNGCDAALLTRLHPYPFRRTLPDKEHPGTTPRGARRRLRHLRVHSSPFNTGADTERTFAMQLTAPSSPYHDAFCHFLQPRSAFFVTPWLQRGDVHAATLAFNHQPLQAAPYAVIKLPTG